MFTRAHPLTTTIRPALTGNRGRLAVLCGLVALCPLPALAQSDIALVVSYTVYELSGDTLPEIWDEMNQNGPKGYAAYTTWYVNWTADCTLSVSASITLPELGDDAYLSEEDEEAFLTMLSNLEDHELTHVGIGYAFAEAVQAMECQGDTDAVLQEHLEMERQYDRDTEHGRTEGAWLIDYIPQ